MAVITISREYGSGGDEIANLVCQDLGFKLLDKSLFARAASEAGLSEQDAVDYSEDNHKIHNFTARILGRSAPIAKVHIWNENEKGVESHVDVTITEDFAVSLAQKAVEMAYGVGNMIIVGRGGQVILRDKPLTLHVRIVAPLEDRIERVKAQLKESNSEFAANINYARVAQDLIEERDRASRDYIRRFYHAAWDHATLYHLVINTGKISIEHAARIIKNEVRTLDEYYRPVEIG